MNTRMVGSTMGSILLFQILIWVLTVGALNGNLSKEKRADGSPLDRVKRDSNDDLLKGHPWENFLRGTPWVNWTRKPYVPQYKDGCTDDGKIAICSGATVTEIPTNLSPSITHIEFHKTAVAIIHNGVFSKYPQLYEILFEENIMQSISKGAFRGLVNLEVLILRQGQLSDTSFGNETFEGVSTLKTLYLGYNKLTKLPIHLLNGAPNIETLRLHNNQIYHVGPDLCCNLESLTYLDMAVNRLSSFVSSDVQQMPNLQTLDISSNYISVFKTGAFNELTNLIHLTASGEDDRLLVEYDAFNANLKFLDLSQNKNIYISANSLAKLQGLEDISLAGCKLAYFDGTPFLYKDNLKVLDVSVNPFVCDCHALWMVEARMLGKPWAMTWEHKGVLCDADHTYRDITSLYPQDLTCDKPYIEAITSTHTTHTRNMPIILEARMMKGYPEGEWIFQDGTRARGKWKGVRARTETVVDPIDHSATITLEIDREFNMTGLVNFTLVASNMAGASRLTFWVYTEPPPGGSVGSHPVCTVTLLLMLILTWVCVK